MNAAKMIYRNLRSYRFISALILINIIVSVFVICFSYGVYQNYNVVIDEGESSQRELTIIPAADDVTQTSVTTKMLIDTITSLSDETLKNIEAIDCDAVVETSAIDKNIFSFYFSYDGNMFHDELKSSPFTDEQYDSYEKIVAINPIIRTDEAVNASITLAATGETWECKNIGDADSIEVGGESFSIVAETGGMGVLSASITAFYNDTALRLRNNSWCVMLKFVTDISRSQYEDIVSAVALNMGDNAKVPDMDIQAASELFYYRTILIVSALISVLAALNFAVLYRFILQKRIKTLVIYRICGCTKARMIRLYLSECMLVGLPAFAVSELLFNTFALPALSNIFEYIVYAYTPVLYLAIFGIYAAASFIVLLIMISVYIGKHSIKELKAGAV